MSVKPKNLQFFIVRSVLEVVRTVQRGRVLREQTPTDPNQKEKNIHLDGRRTTGLSSLLVFLLPTLFANAFSMACKLAPTVTTHIYMT